jgi:ankyrin repeat protein
VKLLIEKGANLDEDDIEGRTPLNVASQNGHLEVVRLLVEAGADIAKKDKDGDDAVGYCYK